MARLPSSVLVEPFRHETLFEDPRECGCVGCRVPINQNARFDQQRAAGADAEGEFGSVRKVRDSIQQACVANLATCSGTAGHK